MKITVDDVQHQASNSPSPLARRDFLKRGAAGIAAATGVSPMGDVRDAKTKREFSAYQQKRRRLLWSLLGDLPLSHRPQAPKLLRTEKGPGYSLEYLVLDLNGIEPVPALLLIPEKRQK
ncbi:MAG: twin-arginine translocation signal domain-containing protein, partial [Blastocatellia bacterium]|nr:twin-arginine translocation signal domain-containing protein [Blastocatellia bacterium]